VVALLALSGVAAGGDDQPPLAEAGLDQQAVAGETVRLDATGSRDPDGDVTGYDWSIETPDGGTTTPNCGTCETTVFSPGTPGRYNVTVTVTDDDGATATDTLYVEVNPAPGPTVSLSGPTEPTVERSGGDPSGQADYVANFSRGGHRVDAVTWQVDGEQTVQRSINDSDANSINYVHSMESAASHTLTVEVTDVAGRSATDSVSVSPRVVTGSGGSSSGDGGTDPYMQADWADRTITFRAPTVDTETGEVVRQSNPTNQELTNVATADPGEAVETDFINDRDNVNENQGKVTDDSDEGYENNNLADDLPSGIGNSIIGAGGTAGSTSNKPTFDDFCPIC
jgi:hypothetical protein